MHLSTFLAAVQAILFFLYFHSQKIYNNHKILKFLDQSSSSTHLPFYWAKWFPEVSTMKSNQKHNESWITLEGWASPPGTPQSCWYQSWPPRWRSRRAGASPERGCAGRPVFWRVDTCKKWAVQWEHTFRLAISGVPTFLGRRWWRWTRPLWARGSWKDAERTDSCRCFLHRCLPVWGKGGSKYIYKNGPKDQKMIFSLSWINVLKAKILFSSFKVM